MTPCTPRDLAVTNPARLRSRLLSVARVGPEASGASGVADLVIPGGVGPSCVACGAATRPLVVSGKWVFWHCTSCRSTSVAPGAMDSREHFNAAYYMASYIPDKDRYVAFLKRLLGPVLLRNGPTVDVGCGAGIALTALEHLGCRGVGIDRSNDACRITKQLDMVVVHADAEFIPFRQGSARNVLLLDVLAHVDHPDKVLREAARILQPGGHLIVKGPRRPTAMYHIARWLPAVLAKALLHIPSLKHVFSEKGFRLLAEGTGLRVVSLWSCSEALGPLDRIQRVKGKTRLLIVCLVAIESLFGASSWVMVAIPTEPRQGSSRP